MSYALGIVAHTSRLDMALDLWNEVAANLISLDGGQRGCFGNHLNAWDMLNNRSGDWKVLLEDDAVPVPGFRKQLDMLLNAAPTSVPAVSLYLGRTRPVGIQPAIRQCIVSGLKVCWILHHEMLHAVGIAIRSELVKDMIATITQPPSVFKPIDEAIGAWAATRGGVAYCWPSIVDHADVDTVIEEHHDGQPRGPVIETPSGVPILARRVAWQTGTRARWDSSSVQLIKAKA